jgi:hypothetical protein
VYAGFATPIINPNGIHTIEAPTFTGPYRPGGQPGEHEAVGHVDPIRGCQHHPVRPQLAYIGAGQLDIRRGSERYEFVRRAAPLM